MNFVTRKSIKNTKYGVLSINKNKNDKQRRKKIQTNKRQNRLINEYQYEKKTAEGHKRE